MRLELVDRRVESPMPDPWADAGAAWSRLEALARLVGPADWTVDLVLVDDETMAGLNARWRGDAGTTDVLSFSYLEREGTGAADLAAGAAEAACDLWLATEGSGDTGTPVVGELVLAPEFVMGRCRNKGWNPDHEWPLLVVHGCLHLLGWEHGDHEARRAMQEREASILARHDLPHPLWERS